MIHTPSKIGTTSASLLLALFGGKTARRIVTWMEKNRKSCEKIDAHQWIEDYWYILLEDNRINAYPDKILIFFTIDICFR